MNRSESTRRELELERRIFRLSQMIDAEQARSDATLKLAKYLANIPKLYFPQVYPPGSCYGGPAQTPWFVSDPGPYYWASYRLADVTTPIFPEQKGCGWSNYYGIATPKDPDVVWRYVVWMTYKGIKKEVLSVTKTCAGWVVVPANGITEIPLLDDANQVQFESEFVFASEIDTVFKENVTSNFLWHDKDSKVIGNIFDYTQRSYRFIGGNVGKTIDPEIPISVTEPPQNHGDPINGICTVNSALFGIPGYPNGPKRPKVTLTGDTSAKDTLKTVKASCKVTLLSVEYGEFPPNSTYPAYIRALAFEKAKAGIDPFIGSSTTFGNDGDQCINFATTGNSTIIEKSIGAINAYMTASGGSVTQLTGGRWAEGVEVVPDNSCTSPPTIYKTLPTKVSLGRPADTGGFGGVFVPKATGFNISYKIWIDQDQTAYQVNFSSNGANLPIPVGPLSPGSSYTFTDADGTFPSQASVYGWSMGTGAYSLGGCKCKGTWRVELP